MGGPVDSDLVAKAKAAKKLTQKPWAPVLGTTIGAFSSWFANRKQFGIWGRCAKAGVNKKSLGRFPDGSFDPGPNSDKADGKSWMWLLEAAAIKPKRVILGVEVVGLTFFGTTFTDAHGQLWQDCVLDLDAVRDPVSGEWTPYARDTIEQCQSLGAWCEISPSGTGAKIFGKLPAVGDSTKLTLNLPDGSTVEVFIGRKAHLCLTGLPCDPDAAVGDSLPDLSQVVEMLQGAAVKPLPKADDNQPLEKQPSPAGGGDSQGRSTPKWFNDQVDLWGLMASDGWTKVTLSPKGWLLAHPTKGVGVGHSARLTIDGKRLINWSSNANVTEDKQGFDSFGYWCHQRGWHCADRQVLKTVEGWLKDGAIGSPPTVLDTVCNPETMGRGGTGGAPFRDTGKPTTERKRNPYKLTKCGDLKAAVPPWLSPRVLPKGVATLITGRAGHGKSAFVRCLVAQLAAGRGVMSCPDGPIQTLWLCFEDSPTSVLVPALIAEGLTREEQDRVLCLSVDEDTMVPDSDGFLRLTETLDDHPGIALVVVDTLAAWATPAGVDLNSQDGVRNTAGALQTMCIKRGLTALIVAHEVKNAETTGTLRAAGSMQIGAACRLHWSVVPDGIGAKLVHMKDNLGMEKPPQIRFRRRTLSKGEVLEKCQELGNDVAPFVDADEHTFGVFCRQDITFGDERFDGEPLINCEDERLPVPCFHASIDTVAIKRATKIGAAEKTLLHKLRVMGDLGTWHLWTDVIGGLEADQSQGTLDKARRGLLASKSIEKMKGIGAQRGILVRILEDDLLLNPVG